MKELIYVADPMCSWCWGFSPVITEVLGRYGKDYSFTLILGGLRAGNTEPMTTEMKEYILGHWKHVQELTGQPFDFSFSVPEGFIYNTEPPCRAVHTVRVLRPEKMMAFFKRIQEAFYVDNQDVTQKDVLTALAEDEGIDPALFAEVFTSAEAVRQTQEDFEAAHTLGVTGFPTLLQRDGDHYRILARGYRPVDRVLDSLGD